MTSSPDVNRLLRAALLIAVSASALHPAQQWTRVTTPNLELYTDAGEKQGRDLALHFEQIRAFFAQASPVKPPGDFPLRVVAFANAEEFRPYSPNALSAAFFATGPGRDYIVMRDTGPESYAIAVHEYVHFVVRHSGLKVPLWLGEGWADVYSSMRRVKDGMAVGDLIPGRMKVLENAKGAWFDFDTLTSVGEKSAIYNEGDRTGLFYAESWALVHMLFLSPDYNANFGKFLMAMHRGSTAAEACQLAYGKSSSQVFAELRAYFDRRKVFGSVFQTSLGKAESEPVLTPAEEFDTRILLADLQGAVGRMDLARLEYERLEKLKPERPDLQKSLGYLFFSLRDNRQAKIHFAKAFDAGSTDAQLCYTLALLQMSSGDTLAAIIASLERAVTTLPTFTDALMQLGAVRSMARQFPGAIEAFMAVPAVTPDKAPAVFNALAYAYMQTGDLVQARAHLATAKKYAKKPEEKKALDDLATLMEARAASAFPPAPGEQRVRVEGSITGLDCSPQGQKVKFTTAANEALLLDLPGTSAVEILHKGTGSLQLSCGKMEPFKAAVEYGRASMMRQGSAGVLRTIQF